MRKLSITLALIVASCTILNAAILEQKRIILDIRSWDTEERTSPHIPIDAFIENNNCILVSFLNEESQSASFKIKDCHGAIIFQEKIISSTNMPYQINLNGFKAGKYQLIYSDEKIEMIGSFLVD